MLESYLQLDRSAFSNLDIPRFQYFIINMNIALDKEEFWIVPKNKAKNTFRFLEDMSQVTFKNYTREDSLRLVIKEFYIIINHPKKYRNVILYGLLLECLFSLILKCSSNWVTTGDVTELSDDALALLQLSLEHSLHMYDKTVSNQLCMGYLHHLLHNYEASYLYFREARRLSKSDSDRSLHGTNRGLLTYRPPSAFYPFRFDAYHEAQMS